MCFLVIYCAVSFGFFFLVGRKYGIDIHEQIIYRRKKPYTLKPCSYSHSRLISNISHHQIKELFLLNSSLLHPPVSRTNDANSFFHRNILSGIEFAMINRSSTLRCNAFNNMGDKIF